MTEPSSNPSASPTPPALPPPAAPPAEFQAAARRVLAAEAPFEALPRLGLFLTGTSTLDLLSPYLVVEGARRGRRLELEIGPYNVLEQLYLDAGSSIYGAGVDAVVLFAQLADLDPVLAERPLSLSIAAQHERVAAVVARLRGLVEAFRQRSRRPLLVANFAPSLRVAAGLADATLETSETELVVALNRALADVCRELGATLLDIHRIATELGTAQWVDKKLYFLGKVPIAPRAQELVSRRIARTLKALTTTPKKCLVLDLDHTLWGGVLGEDGVAGIQVGASYPGNVFVEFQKRALALRDRGVLLAIASKNNEADVREAFEKRPELALSLSDFAATQIHWQDKATSLRNIAAELNIGIDSLVFFDDNPVERAWVRENAPEVLVVEVPKSPLGYVDALEAAEAFDHLSITQEDLGRARLYQVDNERKELASQAGSVEEFLAALEMKIVTGPVDKTTMPRAVQLIAKTNQWNLTTRRHDEGALEAMLEKGAVARWTRVVDKFGDNGLIGLTIAVDEGEGRWRLDTMLMSCRVIGRRVEETMLALVGQEVRERGGQSLVCEFIPTKKNAPAKDFLGSLGFAPLEAHRFLWDFREHEIPLSRHVTIEKENP